MPDLNYSKENFRDLYEALKELMVDWDAGNIEMEYMTRDKVQLALAKVEGKDEIN